MSYEKEQGKPLAPAGLRRDDEESTSAAASSVDFLARRHRKFIKYCGCSAAISLIITMVVLVLVFTVFHIKDPVLKMNSIKINGMDLLNRSRATQGMNLMVEADVSVKNPNSASFKFSNATTHVFYGGALIGEAQIPSGEARPRRTLRMNVSVVVMVDKVLRVGRLGRDLDIGILNVSSHMRLRGKVVITSAIKRSFVVHMNCTMGVDVSTPGIQDWSCRRTVTL